MNSATLQYKRGLHYIISVKNAIRMHHRSRRGIVIGMILLLVISIAIPALQEVLLGRRYELSAATTTLLGSANQNLVKKIAYDPSTDSYIFNKTDLTSANSQDQTTTQAAVAKLLEAQVGGANKAADSLYSVKMPADSNKGLEYYDNNLGLSFGMTPLFKQLPARFQQGRVIYPGEMGIQAVYTAKNNGLKEDIILNKTVGDSLSYSYKLNLPKELEARMMIDGSGGLGIYSADPTLYGDVSYGSADDQAKVMDARMTAKKDHLVFAIPPPTINQSGGKSAANGSAHFVLSDDGSTLTVEASGLKSLHYPLSIDPSVVVTSSTDFSSGNNEGGIVFTADGKIDREGTTGGTLSGWTTASISDGSDTASKRQVGVMVAYNGYLYLIGGQSTNALGTVYYAPINSTTGSISSWTQTSSLTVARMYHGAVAYNGYLYAYGGYGTSSIVSSVEYAKINSNGSVGTWTTSTNAMTTGVCRFGYAAYNGYLYATEGANVASGACTNASTPTNIVQYAPLNGDGSVGTWRNSSATLTADGSGRHSHGTVAYNGRLYIIGGTVNGTGGPTTVYYGSFNSTGDITSWMSTTALTSAKYRFGITVMAGFIYTAGGTGGSATADISFGAILANGQIGAWQTASSYTTGRWGTQMSAYNDTVYINGGSNGTSVLADTQYAKVSAPGVTGGYQTASDHYSNTRYGHASVAYNGYLYIMGGMGTSARSDVQYTPLGANGDATAFAATVSLPDVRYFMGAVAYNGYIYVVGGNNGTSSQSTVWYSQIGANGVLGAWQTTSSLLTARDQHGLVTYNGYLYAVGGTTDDINGIASAEYAKINANGSVGTWQSTTGLDSGRYGLSVLMYAGYLYALGGTTNGSSGLTTVQYTSINADGTLGSWQAGNSFTTGRYWHSAVVYNGYVYLMGGYDGANGLSDVQYAPLNADGSVGSWIAVNSLPATRWRAAVAIYNGYLYLSGGSTSSTSSGDNHVVYTTVINGSTGNSGKVTWNTGTSLSSARYEQGSIAFNGFLYVFGGTTDGSTPLAAVQYAPINPDGTLGSWQTTTSLATAVYGLRTALYNGYVYAFGGTTTGGVVTSAVQYAPINPDGTLGSWQAAGDYASARTGFVARISNGYAYVMGGNIAGTFSNSIKYAPINTNGTLGAWGSTVSFATPRQNFASAMYNGYLYVAGGSAYTAQDGNFDLNDVQFAQVQADGTLASWRYATNYTTARHGESVVAYNGYLYILGGSDASGNLFNDVQLASINNNGTLGSWQTTSSIATPKMQFSAVAYKGYLYTMGGVGANASAVSEVQYGALDSITHSASYTKVVDLGTSATLQSIDFTGLLSTGSTVSYRAAGTDGVFGTALPLTAHTVISSGAVAGSCPTASSMARYVMIIVSIDDGQTAAFADLTANSSYISDFTVTYVASSSHPTPGTRLRGGKAFQSEVLQPLDVCGA